MKISLSTTADIVIVHPATGEDLINENGKPITVTVFGSQSDEFKKAKNKALNKRMMNVGKKTTAETAEADGIDLLVACTKSFNNFAKVEFSNGVVDVKDFKKAYTDDSWFKDQVDAGIANNALFMPAS